MEMGVIDFRGHHFYCLAKECIFLLNLLVNYIPVSITEIINKNILVDTSSVASNGNVIPRDNECKFLS